MSKVKFKKPNPNKKIRTRKFGHIRTKNYDCFFLLFPLIPFALLLDWLNLEYRKSLKWSDRTADKVLNHYVSKMSKYDAKEDAFFFDMGWCSYECIPFGYRKWFQKFHFELYDYLGLTYCPEGYTREIRQEDYTNPMIYFKKILDKQPKV